MSLKNSKTTTSGMEWNTMLGLLTRLKRDGKFREYLLVATGCYFGLRISDLLNLKWSGVLNVDEFTLMETKTKKKRKITINSFLKEVFQTVSQELERQGKFDINDYLFTNRWGNRMSVQYTNKMLHSIFDQYGIKGCGSSHSLRKTFGKRVWEMDNKSERSLVYLSEIFNHTSIATTKRYIGITEKQIADVYLKL
jgi:site-specific recombinase XerD